MFLKTAFDIRSPVTFVGMRLNVRHTWIMCYVGLQVGASMRVARDTEYLLFRSGQAAPWMA